MKEIQRLAMHLPKRFYVVYKVHWRSADGVVVHHASARALGKHVNDVTGASVESTLDILPGDSKMIHSRHHCRSLRRTREVKCPIDSSCFTLLKSLEVLWAHRNHVHVGCVCVHRIMEQYFIEWIDSQRLRC